MLGVLETETGLIVFRKGTIEDIRPGNMARVGTRKRNKSHDIREKNEIRSRDE